MKKIVLSLFLFVSFLTAKSQLSKGNWLVGGTGKLYSFNENYNSFPPPGYNTEWKYTNIDLSASVGYFLADKITLGLRPGFSEKRRFKKYSISNQERF